MDPGYRDGPGQHPEQVRAERLVEVPAGGGGEEDGGEEGGQGVEDVAPVDCLCGVSWGVIGGGSRGEGEGEGGWKGEREEGRGGRKEGEEGGKDGETHLPHRLCDLGNGV